jgi:hypothetical protein
VKSISEEILELRAMNVAELCERYFEVFGRLPRTKQPTWLWRRIAWKIQEQRLGGLSETAKARLEELIGEIDLPIGRENRTIVRSPRRKEVTPGTTVSRVYLDREVRATAVEGGWEYDGTIFGSLSAIAKHVTGSHWNGRHFFGLTKRRAAQ